MQISYGMVCNAHVRQLTVFLLNKRAAENLMADYKTTACLCHGTIALTVACPVEI